MFGCQGISITSWVTVDASCRMEAEVVGDELQIEFEHGALGMAVTEDVIDRLAEILAVGKKELRRVDQQAADKGAALSGRTVA